MVDIYKHLINVEFKYFYYYYYLLLLLLTNQNAVPTISKKSIIDLISRILLARKTMLGPCHIKID